VDNLSEVSVTMTKKSFVTLTSRDDVPFKTKQKTFFDPMVA
jgi:hypothetical protein